MRIGLINIGDELLLGKTLNTNAFDLARWIADLGHELAFTLAIPDRIDTIAEVLHNVVGVSRSLSVVEGADYTENVGPSTTLRDRASFLQRCEYILLTGGLGPTQDDLTRDAVAEFLGVPLEFSNEAAVWLAERLGTSPDSFAEGQRPQLYVPKGSAPLRNVAGTACGFCFERNGVKVFAFPGVPSEFRAMFDMHCKPGLLRRDAVLLRNRIYTFGLSESKQRELLRGFVRPEPFRFSSLPAESGVAISLEAFVNIAEAETLKTKLDAAWEELLSRLPVDCIVDRNGATLAETVFQLLKGRNATVSVAESCTGGAVGYLLTETPGSSAVFKQGYLTYANESKTVLLEVADDLLKAQGAVSEPVALAMAEGCRHAANSDYAVSITGIAGPEGGSEEKPVGLVYIAVASRKRSETRRFQFRGDRKSVRWLSAHSALNQLRLFIINDL